MPTKLCKVVTCKQEFPIINLQDPLITCFLKVSVTWQIKLNTLYIYLHYAKDHQTWQGGDLK